jgi:hypothetical protein
LTSITYPGTREEWLTLAKGDEWDDGTGDYTVYCSDGNLAKGVTGQEGLSYTLNSAGTEYAVTKYDRNAGVTDFVIIPSTYNDLPVTSIEKQAFQYYGNETSVTIPASVISIAEFAFDDCGSLKQINVDQNNSAYSSIDGVLFNKDQTILIYCPPAKEGDYEIPNSVTSIGNYAFYYCNQLTSVKIPDSVTIIGDGAFHSCSGLTSLTIGQNVTTIGNFAFQCCSGLTSLTIPDKVTSIGNRAFNTCSGLTSVTIGKSVMSIGSYAFQECENLTSITFPASVTSIGENVFDYCPLLTSVVFENPNGWWYSTSETATSGEAIEDDLSDASTAAYCLKSTYQFRYWKRTVSEETASDSTTSE